MRFGKLFLCILTAVLLLTAVFAGQKEQEPEGFLSVDVVFDDRTENIAAWQWGDDYYLYLPGNLPLSRMQLRFSGDSSWALDEIALSDRMNCDRFVLNHVYTLTENGEYAGTLKMMRSANVGAMFVETVSGDMEYIHETKGNAETGKLRLYTQTGHLNHDGVISAINGRGNSTWEALKKSYSVELASDADLLGMGSAKKWILLSNVFDVTNLKNKVVYDFAGDFGLAYSPESDWVDLYLNGEYAGLYLLCERNEVHPERVDISRSNSFLVARDAFWRFEEQGKPFITTESKASLRIYHAGMPQEQMLTLWQSAENAILQGDGIDPVTGKTWQDLIDVESWVKKYLVDEVFGNQDGTTLSQFYYYDASADNAKIYAGPAWDYDLCMLLEEENPISSVQQIFAAIPGIYGSRWPSALYGKTQYYQEVVRLYETEFLPLLEVYRNCVIPEYARRIADASAMNASRWGLLNTDTQVSQIETFLALRTEFLNDLWISGSEYCLVSASDLTGATRGYVIKPGSLFQPSFLKENSDSSYTYNWYDAQTGAPVNLEEPVFEDMLIYVRYEPAALPEETEPAEELPEEIPQQATQLSAEEPEDSAVPQEQEAQPPAIELPPLHRTLPLLVFAGVLLAVLVAGAWKAYADRRKKNGA